MAPLEDFPTATWKKLIDVMLTSTFICTKLVVPGMKKLGKGRIINISSVHGKLASPYKSAYVAAKHGVLGFTKVVAKEVGPFGITVNSVCPGFVDTPLMRNQILKQMELNNFSEQEVLEKIFLKDQDIKQLTSPEQIADMCEFLASKNASTITGEAYNISGGWGA
jgi:3-hydroxybutyrate dehydrogenase